MATIISHSSRVPTLLSAMLYVGVVFLLVAGFPQTLRALALRATPPAVTVVPGVNQKVPLLYTGIDFDIVNYTSTSPRGRFETSDGRVLGTVNKTVSIPVVNAVPSTARESLTIPAGIIAEALKHNRRLFYRRVFSDYVSALVQVEVALTIVPASGGAFSFAAVPCGPSAARCGPRRPARPRSPAPRPAGPCGHSCGLVGPGCAQCSTARPGGGGAG